MDLQTLAIVGLAGFLALNLVLTFALLARVAKLVDAQRAGLAIVDEPPELAVGELVPAFATTDVAGLPVTERDLASETLVGFFDPHCKKCEQLRLDLMSRRLDAPLIAFVDGEEAEPASQAVRDQLSAHARVVFTEYDDAVHLAFKITTYPALYRIADGRVTRAGRAFAQVRA